MRRRLTVLLLAVAISGCAATTAYLPTRPVSCHRHGKRCPPTSTTARATTTTARATTSTRATTTTRPATTTTRATTTTIAATTTTQPSTTTTQPAGSFLSYPHQGAPTTINGGTNVVVSNKTWQGFSTKTALVISGAHNVYVHDVDFDANGGDIFLINDTGQIRVENVRARNTGDGTIGSGHGNVVQLNNTFDDGTGGIRDVRALGGRTEDMISIFNSGGVDAAHPLVIENNHLESPLSGPLAWSSSSGTCMNFADLDGAAGAGGHDVVARDNTLLNCGSIGFQMNRPLRVAVTGNVVYGAARATSNVGLSQWSSHSCAACVGNSYTNNRVWWVKANGSASDLWLSGTATVATSGNALHDQTIDPSTLHVVL